MPWRALLLAGGVVTAGCAPGARTPPPSPTTEPHPAPCRLVADSVGPVRAVSAGFDDSADAEQARRAASVAPPVRRDCEGRPLPGIAEAWSRDTSGRFWTLELRRAGPGSLHWTAGALAGTWRADSGARAALRWAGIESLAPLDDRRLVVGFATPQPELPAVFTDLSLGAAVADTEGSVLPDPLGDDPRDAVDQGPDVIGTRDPDLLDYARSRPGLSLHPLPWNRSYLLVTPAGAPLDLDIPSDTAAFRAGLARDAVRAEARSAETPGWWQALTSCPPAPSTASGRPAVPANEAIVYAETDPVARGLAERLVALSRGTRVIARGLAPEGLTLALKGGQARAFVIAVAVHEPVPCRGKSAWPDSATVIPLVETRMQAIIRRGTPALVSDWDGSLRLEAR